MDNNNDDFNFIDFFEDLGNQITQGLKEYEAMEAELPHAKFAAKKQMKKDMEKKISALNEEKTFFITLTQKIEEHRLKTQK